MNVKFNNSRDRIEIIDPIERHREEILTDGSVIIRQVCQDRISYPIDTAVSATIDSFTLPQTRGINIYNKNGRIISELGPNEDISLSNGKYTLEMSRSIKLYIYIRGEVHIHSDRNSKFVELNKCGKVIIGARSYHKQAAGTITTTPNPTDVMQAISTFGSALKTTKPERSFPTLRGHPPLIKLGSDMNIPDEFKVHDNPVRIEVPAELNYIYAITPLVYYLGAEVVPSSKPRLITKNGYTFCLSETNDFESTVQRTLKQIFVLDCIVRTEGNSPGPVYEREVIEPELEFDISAVYNQPLPERLKSYLEVPFSLVDSQYPQWSPTTMVKPNKRNIEFLPFIAESLSLVTTKEDENSRFSANQMRSETTGKPSDLSNQEARSVIHQSWDCNNDSEIRSTIPLTAFHNNIDRKPSEDPLEIRVICNDPNMSDEFVTAHSAYGNRNELPFNITFHHDLTKGQLQDILSYESDFTHYIGHVDENGFRCSNGNLDATSLEDVKTKAFFLNACHSHDQGLGLINAGSIGGIVTHDKIRNDHAVDIGSTIARLLNLGYPLYAAVDIARVKSVVGEQYHIVGDGSISIAQSKTIVPNSCSIDPTEGETQVKINLYESSESKKGSIFTPSINSIPDYHLVQQNIGPYSVTKSELIKFLDINPIPGIINGSIFWSDDFSISDIE